MNKHRKRIVDFRKVKDSVSITQVLEHYNVLDSFTKRSNRMDGPCPIHNGNNIANGDSHSFSVTLSKNTWYCFGECKQGGNILDLVAIIEDCGVRDAAIKISDWFDLDDVELKPRKEKKEKPSKRSKLTKMSDGNSKKRRPTAKSELRVKDKDDQPRPTANVPLRFELKSLETDHQALVALNIMSDTAAQFGTGYCKRGLLKDRIAIPVHNCEGEIMSYVGAATETESNPPYLWPSNFNPALELYNLHRVCKLKDVKSPLVIVCDILDVFELYEVGREHAVALMGNTISKTQLVLLTDYLDESDVTGIHFVARPGTPKLRKTICTLAEIAYVRLTLSHSLGAIADTRQSIKKVA